MNGRTILWVIDGSLGNQLHKNARIKPAEELAKIGWKVLMITSCPPDGFKKSSINYIEVVWPRIYILGAVIYYFKILNHVLSGRIKSDILFFQMDSMATVLLVIPIWQMITKHKKFTVVLDFRTLPMETKTLKGKLREIVFKFGAALSRHLDIKITAITNKMADELHIPKKQLVGIWPSGVDCSEFEKCSKKRRWPGMNDPIRLVYIGAMIAERNLESLIRAAILAKNKGIDIKLDLIGDGKQKNQLKKIAREKGNGFVNVNSPIPNHMIPDLLSKNDIGILPFPDIRKMNVSSAIKMFEYMAAGMPIIATRIQAHANVFNDAGFVFWSDESAESMANAIESAAKQRSRLPLMGMASKNFSRRWSWEKSAEKLSYSLLKAIEC